MFPNQNNILQPPNNAQQQQQQQPKPTKKRRSRKKKPVEVDPEAEREEAELRAKIKASLHSQHVSRKVVEEEEAKKTSSILPSPLAVNMNNNINLGSGQHVTANSNSGQMMMSGGSSMQSSMMGYQQQQQQMGGMSSYNSQQQYSHQQQGSNNNQGFMGAIGNIPASIEQQMQQMKEQIEMQQKQLQGLIPTIMQQQQMYNNSNNSGQGMTMNEHQSFQQQQGAMPQMMMQQQQQNSQLQYEDMVQKNKELYQQTLRGQCPPQITNNNSQRGSSSNQTHPGWINSEQYQGPSVYHQMATQQYNQHQQQPQSQIYCAPTQEQQQHKPNPANRTNNIETLDSSNTKSLVLSSGEESWLKGDGNNSMSVGFHSVEDSAMSASFNSALGHSATSGTSAALKTSSDIAENIGENSTAVVGEGVDTNGPDDRGTTPIASNNSGGKDNTANAGLKPINENEEEKSGGFEHSSLMLSLLEGEFMQSVSGVDMSMDSQTLEALMKKSQSGTDTSLSFQDLINSQKLAASSGQQQQQSGNNTTVSPPSTEAEGEGKTKEPVEEPKQPSDSATSSDTSSQTRYIQLNSDSIHSSVSMDDANNKDSPSNTTTKRPSSKTSSNEVSKNSSRRGSRAIKASKSNPIVKNMMMNDIGLWSTQNNPFDDTSETNEEDDNDISQRTGSADKGAEAFRKSVTEATSELNNSLKKVEHRMSQRLSLNESTDMPDFHSIGASVGTMTNSMDM